jgi:hypothetical protein
VKPSHREWATLDECAHAFASERGTFPRDSIKQDLLAAIWRGEFERDGVCAMRLASLETTDLTITREELREACWGHDGLPHGQRVRKMRTYLSERTDDKGHVYVERRTRLAPYEESDKWSFEELEDTPYVAYSDLYRRAYLDPLQLRVAEAKRVVFPPLSAPVSNEQGTARPEALCRKWLCERMKDGSPQPASKAAIREKAREHFDGLKRRAFDRAWAMAKEDTGNSEWGKPGRKPES